ncbi:MAG: Wzz/FepE/Etk N-terminal domain-containing protein [Clostridia bacterium]|nr:Wzz/FepE/Etk N-terminal domain-containing protein [Clostridia bacterium]
MTNKENSTNRVNIQTLLYVLWRRVFWIIGIGIATALVFALVTKFLVTPVYSSTAKFYVNNNTEKGSTTISSQDIYASQSLAETAIVIIKNNNELMQRVISSSSVECSVEELKEMITATSLSSTEAFAIKVSNTSPEDALSLADAFRTVVPEMIPEVIQGGDVSTFDVPEKAVNPDSPNLFINTLIGGFVGAIVSFLIFFLSEALDNTIYEEADIKGKFDYPIIGLIPTISVEADEERGKKSAKSKKKDRQNRKETEAAK